MKGLVSRVARDHRQEADDTLRATGALGVCTHGSHSGRNTSQGRGVKVCKGASWADTQAHKAHWTGGTSRIRTHPSARSGPSSMLSNSEADKHAHLLAQPKPEAVTPHLCASTARSEPCPAAFLGQSPDHDGADASLRRRPRPSGALSHCAPPLGPRSPVSLCAALFCAPLSPCNTLADTRRPPSTCTALCVTTGVGKHSRRYGVAPNHRPDLVHNPASQTVR